MGITFKGKLLVKEQGSRKYLVVMPKVLEATGVKVFDEQGESVVVEEMLITSAINVNAEKLLGMIQPYEIPMKNPKSPAEMECLGFGLKEFFVEFKKGYVELGCTYKTIKQHRNPEVCQMFIDALRNGPKDLISKGEEILADPKKFVEKLTDDV